MSSTLLYAIVFAVLLKIICFIVSQVKTQYKLRKKVLDYFVTEFASGLIGRLTLIGFL